MRYKDLNPTSNNYNFNIDVLEKVFLDKLKTPFSNTSLFMVLSGAKGFGKTYVICLLALFYTCNFKDYNCILSKYTYKAARTSYMSTLKKVINDLDRYGVTIGQAIAEKEITVHDSDAKCDLVWNNKRKINVVGFDNTANWEGVPAEVGEWGMFAIDEVIPLKETIKDEDNYRYQLINMLIQIVRGQNLATCLDPIKELTCNGWSIFKKHLVIFGFNNHDVGHPIYRLFVDAICPLTEERKKELEEKAVLTYTDSTYMNVGVTIVRGTTAINEHNLNEKLKEFGEGLKDQFPEHYDSLFLGGEHELSLEAYSYRKDLVENAQFFDLEEYLNKKTNRFWFTDITVGCDYADGNDYGDDAVTVIVGFEFNGDIVESVHILNEYSISTKKFKDMTLKVKSICEWLVEVSKKYVIDNDRLYLEDKTKFRIGQDSRTVKDFIKLILETNYDYKKDMLDLNFGVFKSTGKSGWSIESRHYMWKRLLSEKKLFFANQLKVTQVIQGEEIVTKKHGYVYDQLYRCQNHPEKNLRDERPKKNKLDAINAAEHAISFYKYRLFDY
ncbi:hypothetical protein SCORR_v1c04740 [Spiroplasma corruscae]|uniref:Phage terminase large subunit N-terminal domain-containing protein n=1 Tax=Spiroplasma corruscae TaxID=216934 RepID=A0A222ENZ8_9MOLU|nr:hypothetical protein [Spiroplasma corruscae]ASP28246.1 hypothetical protein SCORR_v1c04740 [Spiroplasma corruscae]